MRNLFLVILTIAAVSIGLFSCSNRNNKSNTVQNTSDSLRRKHYRKKNFDSLMIVMRKTLPSQLEETGEFLGNATFNEISDNSELYFDDVIAYLKTGKLDIDDAAILVYAMQNLKIDHYIQLCNIYENLYREKKITEYTLGQVLLPDFPTDKIIGENYSDPRVVSLLNKILKNDKISKDLQKMIANILDGDFSK